MNYEHLVLTSYAVRRLTWCFTRTQCIHSMAASSSGTSGGAKLGSAWTSKIYFDLEADKDDGPDIEITNDELIVRLLYLVDDNELIEHVTIYQNPLTTWQRTDILFNHNFVVFRTQSWWWSIEKNSEGITIQRSKHCYAVRDNYRRSARHPDITEVDSGRGKQTVEYLILWLYLKAELQKTYNYLTSNCKHFAHKVFDFVTQRKRIDLFKTGDGTRTLDSYMLKEMLISEFRGKTHLIADLE